MVAGLPARRRPASKRHATLNRLQVFNRLDEGRGLPYSSLGLCNARHRLHPGMALRFPGSRGFVPVVKQP